MPSRFFTFRFHLSVFVMRSIHMYDFNANQCLRFKKSLCLTAPGLCAVSSGSFNCLVPCDDQGFDQVLLFALVSYVMTGIGSVKLNPLC